MKIARKMKRKIRIALAPVISAAQSRGTISLRKDGYYIILDGKLCSAKHYDNWSAARRAARNFHLKAFIMRGKTLNAKMADERWTIFKQIWRRQNGVPAGGMQA